MAASLLTKIPAMVMKTAIATTTVIRDVIVSLIQTLRMGIQTPIVLGIIIVLCCFSVPWFHYHHTVLEVSQTTWTCTVRPMMNDIVMPISHLVEPIYRFVVGCINIWVSFVRKLVMDMVSISFNCRYTTDIVAVTARSLTAIAKVALLLIEMILRGLLGQSTSHYHAEYTSSLFCHAVGNFTASLSGFTGCYCSVIGYVIDIGTIVIVHDKTLCVVTNSIALIQELISLVLQTLFRIGYWCIEFILWLLYHVTATTTTTPATFPSFDARTILPSIDTAILYADAWICCLSSLVEDVCNGFIAIFVDALRSLYATNDEPYPFIRFSPLNGTSPLNDTTPSRNDAYLYPVEPIHGSLLYDTFIVRKNIKVGAFFRATIPAVTQTTLVTYQLLTAFMANDGNYSAINSDALFSVYAGVCNEAADGMESLGPFIERLPAAYYAFLTTGAAMPYTVPTMIVLGPRVLRHSCLATVHSLHTVTSIGLHVRSYQDYQRMGTLEGLFDCPFVEARQALDALSLDIDVFTSYLPDWKTCQLQTIPCGVIPSLFGVAPFAMPDLACTHPAFGPGELGEMMVFPSRVALATAEYAVSLTLHADSLTTFRAVSTDPIFLQLSAGVSATTAVLDSLVRMYPQTFDDAETVIELTRQFARVCSVYLPLPEDGRDTIRMIVDDIASLATDVLLAAPFSDVQLTVPWESQDGSHETRALSITDIVPVFFPAITIPRTLNATGQALIHTARFMAHTIHTGDITTWTYDKEAFHTTLESYLYLMNTTAHSFFWPLCIAQAIQQPVDCLSEISLPTELFGPNATFCLSDAIPCPYEPLSAILRSWTRALALLPKTVLFPETIPGEMFSDVICELETATASLNDVFAFYHFDLTVPYWDTHAEFAMTDAWASGLYGLLQFARIGNSLLIQALRSTIAPSEYTIADLSCTITTPIYDNITCLSCETLQHSCSQFDTATKSYHCCGDGSCRTSCDQTDDIFASIQQASGSFMAYITYMTAPLAVVDPLVQQTITTTAAIPFLAMETSLTTSMTLLQKIFALIDGDTTSTLPIAPLLEQYACLFPLSREIVGSVVSLPVAITGRLVASIARLSQNDDFATTATTATDELVGATIQLSSGIVEPITAISSLLLGTIGRSIDAIIDGSTPDPLDERLQTMVLESTDALCRISVALGNIPGYIEVFGNALDVSQTGLFCEITALVASATAVPVTIGQQFIGVIGFFTQSATLQQGFDIGAIFDSIRLVIRRGCDLFSGTIYSVVGRLFLTSQSAKDDLHELCDAFGTFIGTTINLVVCSIECLSSIAVRIFDTIYTSISGQDHSPFCSISEDVYDDFRTVFRGGIAWVRSFAYFVPDAYYDTLQNFAGMMQLILVEPSSPLVQSTSPFFKLILSIIDYAASIVGGSSSTGTIKDILDNFVELCTANLSLLGKLITSLLDDVVFRKLEISGYGFVGCMKNLDDCIKDVIKDIVDDITPWSPLPRLQRHIYNEYRNDRTGGEGEEEDADDEDQQPDKKALYSLDIIISTLEDAGVHHCSATLEQLRTTIQLKRLASPTANATTFIQPTVTEAIQHPRFYHRCFICFKLVGSLYKEAARSPVYVDEETAYHVKEMEAYQAVLHKDDPNYSIITDAGLPSYRGELLTADDAAFPAYQSLDQFDATTLYTQQIKAYWIGIMTALYANTSETYAYMDDNSILPDKIYEASVEISNALRSIIYDDGISTLGQTAIHELLTLHLGSSPTTQKEAIIAENQYKSIASALEHITQTYQSHLQQQRYSLLLPSSSPLPSSQLLQHLNRRTFYTVLSRLYDEYITLDTEESTATRSLSVIDDDTLLQQAVVDAIHQHRFLPKKAKKSMNHHYYNPQQYDTINELSQLITSTERLSARQSREIDWSAVTYGTIVIPEFTTEDDETDQCGHVSTNSAWNVYLGNEVSIECPLSCPNCLDESSAASVVMNPCPAAQCPDLVSRHPELQGLCTYRCATAVRSFAFKLFCKQSIVKVSSPEFAVYDVWEPNTDIDDITRHGYGTTWYPVTESMILDLFDVDFDIGGSERGQKEVCTDIGRYGSPQHDFCHTRCSVDNEFSWVRTSNDATPTERELLYDICDSFCSYTSSNCIYPDAEIPCFTSIVAAEACYESCDVTWDDSVYDDPIAGLQYPTIGRAPAYVCSSTDRTCSAYADEQLGDDIHTSCPCPTVDGGTECECVYKNDGRSSTYDARQYVSNFICPNVARHSSNYYFNDLSYETLSERLRPEVRHFFDGPLVHTYTIDDLFPAIGTQSDVIVTPVSYEQRCTVSIHWPVILGGDNGVNHFCSTIHKPINNPTHTVCVNHVVQHDTYATYSHDHREWSERCVKWETYETGYRGYLSGDDCTNDPADGQCDHTFCSSNATIEAPYPPETCDPYLHCAYGTYCPKYEACVVSSTVEMERCDPYYEWHFPGIYDMPTIDEDYYTTCYTEETHIYINPVVCLPVIGHFYTNPLTTSSSSTSTSTSSLPQPPQTMDDAVFFPESSCKDALSVDSPDDIVKIRQHNMFYNTTYSEKPLFCVTNINATFPYITVCLTYTLCPDKDECTGLYECPQCNFFITPGSLFDENCTCEDIIVCEKVYYKNETTTDPFAPQISSSSSSLLPLPSSSSSSSSSSFSFSSSSSSSSSFSSSSSSEEEELLPYAGHHLLFCEDISDYFCEDSIAYGTELYVHEYNVECAQQPEYPTGYETPQKDQLFPSLYPLPWVFEGATSVSCVIPFVHTGDFCSFLCATGPDTEPDCKILFEEEIQCSSYHDLTVPGYPNSFGTPTAIKWFCDQLGMPTFTFTRGFFPIAPANVHRTTGFTTYNYNLVLPFMEATKCQVAGWKWHDFIDKDVFVADGSSILNTQPGCIMLSPYDVLDDYDAINTLTQDECDVIEHHLDRTYFDRADQVAYSHYFHEISTSNSNNIYGNYDLSDLPDPTWVVLPGETYTVVGGFIPPTTSSPSPIPSMAQFTRQSIRNDVYTEHDDDDDDDDYYNYDNEQYIYEDGHILSGEEQLENLMREYIIDQLRYDTLSATIDTQPLIYEPLALEPILRTVQQTYARSTIAPTCTAPLASCPVLQCPPMQPLDPHQCTSFMAVDPLVYYGPSSTSTWTQSPLYTGEQTCSAIIGTPCSTNLLPYQQVVDDPGWNADITPFFTDANDTDTVIIGGTAKTRFINALKLIVFPNTTSSSSSSSSSLPSITPAASSHFFGALFYQIDAIACSSIPGSAPCRRLTTSRSQIAASALPSMQSTTTITEKTQVIQTHYRSSIYDDLSDIQMDCYLLCSYDIEAFLGRSCLWEVIAKESVFHDAIVFVIDALHSTCNAIGLGTGEDHFYDGVPVLERVTLPFVREPVIPAAHLRTWGNGNLLFAFCWRVVTNILSFFSVTIDHPLTMQTIANDAVLAVIGYDNATTFLNTTADFLSTYNIDREKGDVGAAFWTIYLTPLGGDCAALNGSDTIWGIPVYSPYWFPRLPLWAVSFANSIADYLLGYAMLAPPALVYTPDECATSTALALPFTDTCPCTPSFVNCGEHHGFSSPIRWASFLLHYTAPSFATNKYVRMLASILALRNELDSYAHVADRSDYSDYVYCFVVTSPGMFWVVVAFGIILALLIYVMTLVLYPIEFLINTIFYGFFSTVSFIFGRYGSFLYNSSPSLPPFIPRYRREPSPEPPPEPFTLPAVPHMGQLITRKPTPKNKILKNKHQKPKFSPHRKQHTS